MIAARFFFGFPVCSRLLGRARFAWMAASCRAAFTPLLALLLALGSAQAVLAQTATSGGTSVFASIVDPQSLARDAGGNIYVTATGGAYKYSPLGVETQIDFNGSDLGITVDSSGNVYVGQGNNIVDLSTGSVVATLPGEVFYLAVDASGTIYASIYQEVYKVASGQAPTLVASIAPSPDSLLGLAVDASGDLYIASNDVVNDELSYVQELKPDGTTIKYDFGNQLGASFIYEAQGIAVDPAGNIYLADADSLYEYLPASGTTRTLTSQSGRLYGVALDGNGNVFVASQQVEQILRIAPPSAVNFGSVNVCPAGQTTPAPCTQTEQLTFTITGTGVFGTPVALTQGATGLDFSIPAAGDTCVGAQVAGTTCTVNVTFAPTVAGPRNGAVELVDASGNVLATTNVYGTGQGPQLAFNSGNQSTVNATGLSSPNGVAVDGAGNLFIVDGLENTVVKITPSGTQTTIISGLNAPGQIAVDGAGNLFVADQANGRVVKVSAANGAETTVGSGFQGPYGVAVDGAGDVFVTDDGSNLVTEVIAATGAQVTLGNGFSFPLGVAVDGAGDVFVADTFNNRVVEVPAGGGAEITIGYGFANALGVAVDGAGDVFVADAAQGAIVEIPAGGGAQFSIGDGLIEPDALAIDSGGDLFIVGGGGQVVKLNRATPPTFSFAATAVGSTSADSPMSTQIQNIGNQPLNAVPPGLEVGTNFAQVFGATPFTDCTSSFSLTSGQLCNLSIDFTPQQIGSIQTVAIFADNSLNANPVTIQSVALNGTGTAIANTLAFNAPAAGSSYAYGQTVTAMASSNSSAAITYSVASGPAAQLGAATFQLTGVGQVTLQAKQPASGNYAAGTAMVTFNATQAATATTLTGSVASGATTGTLTAMVAPTNAGTYPVALTGSVTFYDSSTSPNTNIGTATLTAGKASITTPAYTTSQSFYAVYTGSTDYAQSQSNTVPLSFPVAPTITFTVASQTYGAAPFQVSASSNSQGKITYSVVSGPATISGSTVTLTGAGTVKLQASQLASGNYLAGSATSTFTAAQAATRTTLSGAINTGASTATLSASVAPQTSGTYPTALTGMVTFYNNGTAIGTATIAGGKATLTTATYTGMQSFTAVYNGDTNYTASPTSNSVPLSFNVAPTITFTTAATYAYGQSFQLAASSNSTGAFTYSLVSGPATVTTSGAVTVTGEGKVTVQASEAAATGYTAGSKQTSFAAVQATTSTKLTATAVKSGYGSAASLTATVTPQFSGTPSGSVTFYDGLTKLAIITLSGRTASYTTSQLVGAQHSYSATYSGDTNFTGSPSNTAALTIPVTAVSLQLASTNLVYPLPPAFEIIVSPANGKPAPTGTVTIYDGTAAVATYPLYALSNGYLIGLVLPPLSVGTHPLTAVYSGDANYAPGTSATVTVTVTPGPVKLSLSCQSTSLKLGQTLTCTVNADEGLLPVAGTVTYTVTGWGSGSVILNKAGQATITYPTPQKGSFTLTATYAAQGNYQAASSASVNFTVN
jgi:sugar lactone lactonase YvrE